MMKSESGFATRILGRPLICLDMSLLYDDNSGSNPFVLSYYTFYASMVSVIGVHVQTYAAKLPIFGTCVTIYVQRR